MQSYVRPGSSAVASELPCSYNRNCRAHSRKTTNPASASFDSCKTPIQQYQVAHHVLCKCSFAGLGDQLSHRTAGCKYSCKLDSHNLQHKTLDIITLFHKAGSPASTRAAALLKQISANASSFATEDQASDHTPQTAKPRDEFELNITEDLPTEDQLRTILGYVGPSKVGSVVKGASSESDAIKKFKSSTDAFQHPVVCLSSAMVLQLP